MSLTRARHRTVVARLLLALVGAPLLVVATGGSASACSCANQSLQASRDRADVVLTGQVLRREAPTDARSSADPATYVVRVDRVFKGQARTTQEVVTAVSGASCGLELPGSGAVLLFARTGAPETLVPSPAPGQLTASLCGGSRVGSTAPASFGGGYPPLSGGRPEASPEPAPAAGVPAVVPVGVGMLGAAVLLAVLARRRRRG